MIAWLRLGLVGWALSGHGGGSGAESEEEGPSAAAAADRGEGGLRSGGGCGARLECKPHAGCGPSGDAGGAWMASQGAWEPGADVAAARKAALGRMAKELIDAGRMEWLRSRYAHAECVCYAPASVTGEARLFLAIAAEFCC